MTAPASRMSTFTAFLRAFRKPYAYDVRRASYLRKRRESRPPPRVRSDA
ncbi:MAG TPA: hypothetical protein VF950_08670 [Planctomycetota bacterium]